MKSESLAQKGADTGIILTKSNAAFVVYQPANDSILYANDAFVQLSGYSDLRLYESGSFSLILKNDQNPTDPATKWQLLTSHQISLEVVLSISGFCWEGDSSVQLIQISPCKSSLFEDIQNSLSSLVGIEYFGYVASFINHHLKADYTIIGTINEMGTHFTLITSVGQKEAIINRPYPIAKSPSAEVLKRDFVFYPDQLYSLFPSQKELKKEKIRAFAEMSIYNQQEETIGILACFFRNPQDQESQIRHAIYSFGERMNAELERFCLEKELEDREQRISFALEAGGLSVYDWRPQEDITTYTKNIHSLLGYPEGAFEMNFKIWNTMVHPDDRPALKDHAEKIKAGYKQEAYIRYRVKTKEGKYVWLNSISQPVALDDKGRATRIIGVFRNIDKLVESEEKLKQNEERFRALAENFVGVAYMCHYDRNYTPIYINDEIKKISGYSKTDFLDDKISIYDLLVAEDKEDQLYAIKQLVKNKTPFIKQYRLQTKNGDLKWIESRGNAIFSDDGTATYIIGSIVDISYQKEVERSLVSNKTKLNEQLQLLQSLHKELKTSENRWAFALEGNGDGVWDIDLKRNKILFSKMAYRLIGYENQSGERPLSILNDIIHPDYLKQFWTAAENSRKPPYHSLYLEIPFRDKSGHFKWVLLRGKVVEFTRSGKPKRMIGTIIDLTNSRHQKRELAIYEEMIKQNPSAIIFTDINGNIEFCNNYTLQLFGYQTHEIIQKPFDFLAPKESKCMERLLKVLGTDHRFSGDLSLISREGNEIIGHVNASILIDEHGETVGLVITIVDITNIRKLENDLLKLQNEKLENELFYQRQQTEMIINVQESEKENLARELHDGLGQILSLAKMRLDNLDDRIIEENREEFQQIKQLIERSTTDLKSITRDLMPLSLRQLGLESALTVLLEDYKLAHQHLEIKLKISLKGYKPNEKCSINIYRIAQEAVNNSMKYSKAKVLSLMLIKLNNNLHLMIEDNGIGFDFEENFKKNKSFGLKTIQERAKLLGAKLLVNTAPGKGTTINLNIPINALEI